MKAITLTEPYASLVACGAKRIETRSWYTAYRGKVAIHAAKGMTGRDLDIVEYTPAILDAFEGSGGVGWSGHRPKVKDAFAESRGRVLAFTSILDCLPSHLVAFGLEPGATFPSDEAKYLASPEEAQLGDFTPGRWAWIFGDVYRLWNPVEATGALGLWEWEVGEPPHADLVDFDWQEARSAVPYGL